MQRQRSSAAFWRKIVHMKQLGYPWHGREQIYLLRYIENYRILSDIYYQYNPKKGKGETLRAVDAFMQPAPDKQDICGNIIDMPLLSELESCLSRL
jgi:hypothetical protein